MTRLGSDVFVAASSEAVSFELDFRMALGGNPAVAGGTRWGTQRPRGPAGPPQPSKGAVLASAWAASGVLARLALPWDCEGLKL